MKFPPFFLLILSATLLTLSACKKEASTPPISNDQGNHPQLLLLEGEEEQIHTLIDTDPVWQEVHFAILQACNKFFKKELLERKLIGRRLLSVSRECIRRVFYLSYAYRMTGDERFLARAEAEMLAVAGFSDWNPSHFLDVAEMTMGMAIGYDWLYHDLPESSRTKIRQAIRTKGLEPSFDNNYNWFLGSTNNWNQVCNAGMTFGAVALAGAYPELARDVIDRAVSTIELPMGVYQPDGAYPEGYAYWGYGTSMNVLFLHALEKAMGSDYGLPQMPGFLETAGFLQHMLGTTSLCFNWGDCNLGGSLKPAMFWFAEQTSDPSLLWMERKFLEIDDYSRLTGDRLLPAILIWGKNIPMDQITAPERKVWVGQGSNPVALMRTSWTDPQAIYLGFKAGSPSVNHGHMDVGSFIMEADGVRWASDFGSQDYESLESKGIQVFGRAQDAQRWSIFRFNNYVHNTLTVDGELQRVDGYAGIDRYSEDPAFPFAISDISTVYDGQLQQSRRGVGIREEQYVIVRDEVSTLDRPTVIRWTMLTTANVSLTENGATLIKDGKTLYMRVSGPDNLQMRTWSTDPGTDYDAPNPGKTLLGFECELPANSSERFQVLLIPEDATGAVSPFDQPLSEW
ncbi:heparinase II/III domain-containing protein [Flavilitoribacter nigricans]|uniref:Heparinase n=1 Tax=Flavilitoribacter nigricans (strain ATCC 23147 / DSM 23189 / NBRC 102662 / NCIMB 1420 / SS-2) TaxID=1122177 RepID=A0A2D0N9S0_FLAN2|nr:heparinase II/III family protein [Flavilitoribacter nigricans]PHN04889.1 heparinase [Flavilitoribacter nigricans DSM 23189 = NBRC 102662]